jgi:hypothetical protein
MLRVRWRVGVGKDRFKKYVKSFQPKREKYIIDLFREGAAYDGIRISVRRIESTYDGDHSTGRESGGSNPARQTRRELKEKLVEQTERIAELESQVTELEGTIHANSCENDEYLSELGACFAALCQELGSLRSFGSWPITMRLQAEAFAKQLGVERSW